MAMHKYKCGLCGEIKMLSCKHLWVRYYCEVKSSWTKLWRVK